MIQKRKTYASLIKASQSPEYAIPTIAYTRDTIVRRGINICVNEISYETRTFSYRLSA